MAKYTKRDLVIYLDIGLVGTFVSWKEKSTEQDYVYLEYVPLNSFPPKKIVHPVAIHKDHLSDIPGSKDFKGVQSNIKLIYTGEPGSAVKKLTEEQLQIIEELREKLRKAKMQIASYKQESDDARSGVNKTISSMRQINKSDAPVSRNPFDSFGGGYGRPPPPFSNEEYEDY